MLLFIFFLFLESLMADTGDAVLIGFIITVTLIGIGGGVSLGVFICVKWRECVKRRMPVVPSRQPTRRNRRIRVHNATPQQTRRNTGWEIKNCPLTVPKNSFQ